MNMQAAPFSAREFRRRSHDRGAYDAEAHHGDHRLNPHHSRVISPQDLRDAAVLVPVVDHGDEATVILTKRAETLRNHTGQVAFPGGRIDATDASPEETALRETAEEIGLSRDFIDIIGRMPDYLSGSGYRIMPVLAIVRPGFVLSINADEVDAAFEVPLRFLMDPSNHTLLSRMFGEEEWFFYDMPYDSQRIWGVTAGIIRALYEELYQ